MKTKEKTGVVEVLEPGAAVRLRGLSGGRPTCRCGSPSPLVGSFRRPFPFDAPRLTPPFRD